MISPKHVKFLNYDLKIHPYHQDAIIEHVVREGYTDDVQPFWLKYDVRSLNEDSVAGTYEDGPVPGDFHYRLDPRAEWKWDQNPVKDILVNQLLVVWHLFHKMTRVKVFIQKPGMDIPAHRDFIAGNQYKHFKDRYNSQFGMFYGVYTSHPNLQVETNTRHADQGYYTLKIPITSQPSDHGKPYIIDPDGKKQYIQSNDRAYLLNEVEVYHGCEPVDFYRGVVFVDGIINMAAIDATY